MSQQVYATEAELQELIAHHPDLLSADGEPRRWLLIAREFGIASEPDGSDRWSVDHLFIDDSAIPALVEVKRSTDARIRREVVGQMLDYAANALSHWSAETIRARFEPIWSGVAPKDVIAQALGGDVDPEEFWSQVETKPGRRPDAPDLRRRCDPQRTAGAVVEFLNRHMAQVEVLALELRQYVDAGGEHQTLVPTLVGKTQAARQAKRHRERRDWDRESWLRSTERSAASPRRRSLSGYSDGPTSTTRRSRSRSGPPPGRVPSSPWTPSKPSRFSRVHRRISRSPLRCVLEDAAVRPLRRTSRDPEPPERHPEREDRRRQAGEVPRRRCHRRSGSDSLRDVSSRPLVGSFARYSPGSSNVLDQATPAERGRHSEARDEAPPDKWHKAGTSAAIATDPP